MLDPHEPDRQFADNLEWQIGGEIRRRNRAVANVRPLWTLARTAALVVVSMGLGAAAMGASAHIEQSSRTEALTASLQVRLDVARQRLEVAGSEIERVEERIRLGTAMPIERQSARLFVAESEAEVRRLELQLDEVNRSGREPRDDLSAPRVGGRDFVSERLVLAADAARQRLEAIGAEIRAQQLRVDVGTMRSFELDGARLTLAEAEDHLAVLQGSLRVREQFLAGELSAAEAERRGLIVEAQARATTARRRVELMRAEQARTERLVAVGAAEPTALRMVTLGVSEAEAELTLAEIELQLLEQLAEARR